MPKAKFKRKGAPLEVLQKIEEKDQCKFRKHNGGVVEKFKKYNTESTILFLPEEIICIILESLPGTETLNTSSVGNVGMLAWTISSNFCFHTSLD